MSTATPGLAIVGGPSRFARLRSLGLFERAGLTTLVLLTAVALLAPLLAPHAAGDPIGPSFQAPGAPGAVLGTDDLGRDVLSRVLLGMRLSWLSALGVVGVSVVIGALVGLAAGVVGGWVDAVLMRFTDLALALPGPVLAIAVVVALGPGLFHTLLAVTIVWWPWYARLIRGEARALAARPHFEAARVAGAGWTRLAMRHVLPGVLPPILVAASVDLGALILTLAGLAFIGLGATPPSPELGGMASAGLPYLLGHAWIPLAPAFAVALLAFVANFAGDALRDLLEEV